MFKAKCMMLIVGATMLVLASAQPEVNLTELCALAPSSMILRPNTCTDWYKCPSTPEALDADEGSCVFGLYFNKNTGKCEYKDNVVCPFANVAAPSKNRCSRAAEGTFLPVEGQCNAYIYCQGGGEKQSFCPSNLVFDPTKKACVYTQQYDCPEHKQKTQSDIMCNSLAEGFLFADKQDCSKYNLCNKGVLERHSCNSSHAWSFLQRKCVPVDDAVCYPSAKKPEPELKVCINHVGPVSDAVSCSGYYFCKKVANDTHDRKPEHFTCNPGLFFDSSTLSCRDRVNVKCSLDRCEGMGNKYVNVAGDCRAYALCSNNKISTRNLCPNTYYFDERKQGCTPQVIKYLACTA